MSCALHREVEEHIGDHSELVRNEWWPFHSCYCGGPLNNTYMTIGDDFETECYHCYASSFQDRLLESRWSFLSYAGRIAEALVAEGVEVIQRSRRKNCTLKERCEMAASIGSVRIGLLWQRNAGIYGDSLDISPVFLGVAHSDKSLFSFTSS